MSNKQNSDGFIDPERPYTLEGLARALGQSPRWVRENFINTGEIEAAKRGTLIVIPGWVFKNWVERNLGCDGDDEEKT